ncbi:MAG: PhoH family protein [Sarcina sp.]
MIKTYVLDTNVLLHSPNALFSFGNNEVIIPQIVLEELDNMKKNNSDLGFNARQVARLLDSLRENGNLNEGVKLDNEGTLRVDSGDYNVEMPEGLDKNKADNIILKVCLGLTEKGNDVTLITKDMFERIKADTLRIKADDFYDDVMPKYDKQYTARKDVYTTSQNLDLFFKNKSLGIKDVLYYDAHLADYIEPELEVNEFLIIHSNDNNKQTALGRYDGKRIVPLYYGKNHNIMGISPRNVGQKFMLECLSVDAKKAPLVIIKGPAGTAKTLFSLAVGLQKIIEEHNGEYRRILVCRPNVTMDEEIGFLPGTEKEKIAPFMRPIYDNLEILIDSDENARYSNEIELNDKIEELFDRRIITTEAVAYLRGRSIVKSWVIIDEAQNLTPKQVKSIVTRAGEGSKIILIGDPEQIDHAFLDSRSNGLCYASEKMKGSPLCYQVTLEYDECERSDLAYEASKRL